MIRADRGGAAWRQRPMSRLAPVVSRREARRSPRGRVDGQVDSCAALARRYDTVWNPEYGRPYTQIGRDPTQPGRAGSSRTSPAFTAGTRTSSPSSRTTCSSWTPMRSQPRVFHEVYLGRPTSAFAELVGAPVRPLRRLRTRRPVAPRRDPRVRRAAPLDARALSRAGGRERQPVGACRGTARSAARDRGCGGRRRASRGPS